MNPLLSIIGCLLSFLSLAQNVGIGTSTPTQMLDVAGNIKGSNLLASGFVGINTTSPAYRLHVVDGSLAISNTTDAVTWSMAYNSSSNYFTVNQSGISRMVIANGGNVGIGTTSPAYKLDVNGSVAAASAAIEGNLTVNNGYGILRNASSGTQLKYYTFTGDFGFTNFAGHTLSGPHQVNFPGAADFNSAPRVMIGNYISIGGSAGHLFSIVPAVTNVNSSGFQIYFFNSSTLSATMNFTMTFICIGN